MHDTLLHNEFENKGIDKDTLKRLESKSLVRFKTREEFLDAYSELRFKGYTIKDFLVISHINYILQLK